jgi:hypothetical protein
VLIDQLQETVDEFVAFVVADLPERDFAAEVLIAVRVTAGAAQRALSRDLNRQCRPIAAQNPSPSCDNPVHAFDYITSVIFRSAASA